MNFLVLKKKTLNLRQKNTPQQRCEEFFLLNFFYAIYNYGLTTVLPFIVTAAIRANNLPSTVAPVFNEMD